MREKKDRNIAILEDINSGKFDYLVDIAKKWDIKPQIVSRIKARYLKKVAEENKNNENKHGQSNHGSK